MSHSKVESVFSWPVRVYFQDTDVGGVAYHGSYVNFLERARTEWLRERCGYSNIGLIREFGLIFVVRSLRLDFFRPALLDDLLDVRVQLKDVGRSRVGLHQAVWRNQDKLVEAEIHLVCVTADQFKPVSIPEALRQQWKNERIT